MARPDINRPLTLGAAIMITLVGMSMLHVQPLFVGIGADHLGFDGAQLGLLASSETLGMGLASALAVLWIRRVNWRHTAWLAIVITLLGNLASLYATGFVSLVTLRALTAFFGEGVALAIGVAAISEARDTDRAFAIKVIAYVLQMILGLVALPYAIEIWGVAGLLVPVAAFVAICLPAPAFIPPRAGEIAAQVAASGSANGPVFWGLGAQFVWYMGMVGALWAFIERIGASAGFAQTDIGLTLALGTGLSVIGSVVATVLGDRFGKLWPFLLTMAVQILGVLWLVDVSSLAVYMTTWLVINGVWNYGLPYLYAAVADADYSGRFVVMVPTGQTLGAAVGAAMAGFLVVGADFSQVLYFVVATNLIAAALYTAMILKTRPSLAQQESV